MMIDPAGFEDRGARNAPADALRAAIAGMGGLAETALARALAALRGRHDEAARAVIAGDRAIDAAERQVGALVAALLIERRPGAAELRDILAAYRIAGLIERVGDYAKTIAKRTRSIGIADAAEPMRLVANLGEGVRELLRLALDAYAARDAAAAAAVRERDGEVDALYGALFAMLIERMATTPGEVRALSELMFVAKSLERVGDQATNIAELVYHAATGEQLPDRHGTG